MFGDEHGTPFSTESALRRDVNTKGQLDGDRKEVSQMASFFKLTVGQQTEFNRILSDAGFSKEMVEAIIAKPSIASGIVKSVQAAQDDLAKDRFARFAHLLRPTSRQAADLCKLNEKMNKDMRVPDSWLDNLETDDEHVQSLERLKVYFVVKDTLKETLAYNWKLVGLTQPAIYHSGFSTNAANLRLDKTACDYAPGVHLITINLVDNWEPQNGRSVDQVRRSALATGQKLAGIEVLAAYALQDPRLLQSQDGKNLPYCNLAGLQQGDGFGQVLDLRFRWNSGYCKACLNSWFSCCVYRDCATPSVAA